ncbi:MAG: hypothetical protein GX775_01965 [Erysipelothrix sp.]|nr:hypothetical protein [Erysipelothrix sp.]
MKVKEIGNINENIYRLPVDKVYEALSSSPQGRTSFIITHRLSTIKNADLILVMNDGDIIESGKHEQLLEQGGFYYDLYNSQFDRNDE